MAFSRPGVEPHAAVSKVAQYMREHNLAEMLVDDENKIPSHALVDEMFEDQELDHAVAWLPLGAGLIENSTPRGGWNPHVRLEVLDAWLAANPEPEPQEIEATITINVSAPDVAGVADYLRFVAKQIEEDCTSGHVAAGTNWDSTGL